MSVRGRPGAAPVVGYRTGCVGMQDASSGDRRRGWFKRDTLSLQTAVNRARKYTEFQFEGSHRKIFNNAAEVLRSQQALFDRLEKTQGYLFDSDYFTMVVRENSRLDEAVRCSIVEFLLRYRAQSEGMFPLKLGPKDLPVYIVQNKKWKRPLDTNGAVWFSEDVEKDVAERVKQCLLLTTPERALVDKMQELSVAEEPTTAAKLKAKRKRWFDRDSRKTQNYLNMAEERRGYSAVLGTTAYENTRRALALQAQLWHHLEDAGGTLVQKKFRQLVLDVPPASADMPEVDALLDAQWDKTVVQSLLYFLTRYATTPDLWDVEPYGSEELGGRPKELQGKLILDAGTRRDLEFMKTYEYDEGGRANPAEYELKQLLFPTTPGYRY